MPDLAVIMSIYKNDKLEFVKQSVQSILTQTYTNFIFFIAFDGPVSIEIDTYIINIKDERIKLYRIEENGGLARALNFLLEIVLNNPEYKYIARMDADDISLPRRFEKQKIFLNLNPEISCVGCWYEEINEHGSQIRYTKLPIKHNDLQRRYYTHTPFAHPSVMYRIELIVLAGFYPTDTIFMEDNVLWGNALKVGLQFANIPEYLLKFRKDKDFYRRRSGFLYGWRYAKTKIEINKSLNAPIVSILLVLISAFIRMMPSYFGKLFHIMLKY